MLGIEPSYLLTWRLLASLISKRIGQDLQQNGKKATFKSMQSNDFDFGALNVIKTNIANSVDRKVLKNFHT